MARRPAPLPFLLRSLLGFVLFLCASTPAVSAQEERPARIEVDQDTGAPVVVLGDLLQDGGLRRALHSGLPLRMRVVVELWKDRFFDSQQGLAEWRASVVYEPLQGTYRVQAGEGGEGEDRRLASLAQLRSALGRRVSLPLRPREEGSFYYLGFLEVETLSLSDLEELQRWLRGDLAPAVAGEEGVESAVEKGVRRLVVRVLGLPAHRVHMRTPVFRWEGGEEAPGG